MIVSDNRLKNIQQQIEKIKLKIQKSKPVYLCEDSQFTDADLAKFIDKPYSELKSAFSKHKIIVDVIQECIYRKDPKLFGYKKALCALNKLQGHINEEATL